MLIEYMFCFVKLSKTKICFSVSKANLDPLKLKLHDEFLHDLLDRLDGWKGSIEVLDSLGLELVVFALGLEGEDLTEVKFRVVHY